MPKNAFLKLASCASQNIARGMFGNVPPDAILGKSGFAQAIMPQYLAQTKTAGFERGFFGTMSKIAMSAGGWMGMPAPSDPTEQNPSTSSYEKPKPVGTVPTDPPPQKTNGIPTSAMTRSADSTTAAGRTAGTAYMGRIVRQGMSKGHEGSVAPHGATLG